VNTARNRLLAIGLVVLATAAVSGCETAILWGLWPPPNEEVRLNLEERRWERKLQALVGASKESVRRKMGPPTEMREMVLPTDEIPWMGPQRALTGVLRPGQGFDEWVFEEPGWRLYVWFADPSEKEPDRARWKVLATNVDREGTVY